MLDIAQLTVPGRIQDLSLALGAGEILAVVGSQGSGKTTLIRALAGLEPIVAGRITFRGQAFHDAVRAGVVGVVLPQQEFPARLRAVEIMNLFARMRGLGSSRIEPLLGGLGLQEVAQRRFDKLRPGEQGRLRLAVALLSDPALLLLDEPIGDVDRESAHILADAIGEAATAGKAVLITTWGRPDLLALATRKLYLEDGLLLVPAAPVTGSTPSESESTDEAGAKRPGASVTQIAARREERIFLLDSSEILYAYAEAKSVFVMTPSGPYQVMATLADLEERLGSAFFRAHKGYLVNLSAVREIAAWTRDSFSLILRDGKELPLSKHRAPELRRLLGW